MAVRVYRERAEEIKQLLTSGTLTFHKKRGSVRNTCRTSVRNVIRACCVALVSSEGAVLVGEVMPKFASVLLIRDAHA